jgi:REP element-mobilizing transposase RayT
MIMSRNIVPLITGEKYHVYNRGVDKRNTYLDKHDYLRFYETLAFFNTKEPTQNYKLAKNKYSKNLPRLVQIHAYALLPNHFHLLLEQLTDGGISEFMKRVSGGYVSYFNEKYERSGFLFQGRYKKVHVNSDPQYTYLFSYINENHFVHNLDFKREICHTSSLHYQAVQTSKLLKKIDSVYNQKEAQLLAQDIYHRRNATKDVFD